MGCSFNSEDARERRSETAVGENERPAKRMGSGASGSDGKDEVLVARVSGERWGDDEGGESLMVLPGCSATAFPFPLSTLGPSFSSLKRSCVVPSLGASSAKLAAFLWMSLKL
jgi:hypothetical protein